MNDFLSELPKLGIAGAMLWWFATRADNSLGKILRSLDRLTRAVLLALQSMKAIDPHLRDQAREQLRIHDEETAEDQK